MGSMEPLQSPWSFVTGAGSRVLIAQPQALGCQLTSVNKQWRVVHPPTVIRHTEARDTRLFWYACRCSYAGAVSRVKQSTATCWTWMITKDLVDGCIDQYSISSTTTYTLHKPPVRRTASYRHECIHGYVYTTCINTYIYIYACVYIYIYIYIHMWRGRERGRERERERDTHTHTQHRCTYIHARIYLGPVAFQAPLDLGSRIWTSVCCTRERIILYSMEWTAFPSSNINSTLFAN